MKTKGINNLMFVLWFTNEMICQFLSLVHAREHIFISNYKYLLHLLKSIVTLYSLINNETT